MTRYEFYLKTKYFKDESIVKVTTINGEITGTVYQENESYVVIDEIRMLGDKRIAHYKDILEITEVTGQSRQTI